MLEEVVEHVIQGSTLIEFYQGLVYAVVGRMLVSHPGSVDDVAQEAFLKAYRALPGFKREARFSSWLYQIAVNLCRDRLRRRKGRSLVSLDALEEVGPVIAGRGLAAHDLVEQLDLRRAVRRAVGALSEEQREVLILKEYQGLTFLEIAQALDLPVSTVKTRLYRGLGQLRLRLEDEGIRDAEPVPVR